LEVQLPAIQNFFRNVVLRHSLLIAIALFLLLSFLFSWKFVDLYYKDEVAYLAAAERYAHGDFANAPNSLWGPGISWLVAIPIALGLNSVWSARLVTHLLGIATLFAAGRLATTLRLSPLNRAAYLLILVPYMVYFSTLGLCSEPALIAILTLEFSILFDGDLPARRHAGLLCGLLGGLAYYTKGFGLPFFLAQFTVCCALFWLAQSSAASRRQIVRQFVGGMSVFAVLVAAWVAVLYKKYGEVTPGITGKYNYQIVGPGKVDRPTTQMGFAGPPPGTTVSIWEDPAYLYREPGAVKCCLTDWSPFQSSAAFKHQLGLIKLNVGRTVKSLLRFSVLSPVVLAAALLFLLAPLLPATPRLLFGGDGEPGPIETGPEPGRAGVTAWLARIGRALLSPMRLQLTQILLTICIFVVPYMSVFSDERLLWPIVPLLVALATILSTQAMDLVPAGRRIFVLGGLGLVALSFIALPLKKLAADTTFRRVAADAAGQLTGAGLNSVNFASSGDYGSSMVLGYYLKSRYFGQPAPGQTGADILADLQRNKVGYYLVWDEPAKPIAGMTLSRSLVAAGRMLSVYRVGGASSGESSGAEPAGK
jgi:4-amino-4-deoxy-L-arabinose transferase-like glycosyltransferase